MSSSPTDLATAVDVVMPAMGSSVVEGTIVDWRVAVGDVVAADETICEISTDKVESECPSPAAGTVIELLVEAGETVDVGTVLARIAPEGAVVAAPAEAPPASDPADPRDEVAAESVTAVVADGGDRRQALQRSSPVALRIATGHGLDVATVTGSGRNGRVTKGDVLRAIEDGVGGDEPPMHIESPYRHDPNVPVAGAEPRSSSPRQKPASAAGTTPVPAPAPATPPDDLGGTVTPMSRMRRSIGTAMRRALDSAAHCTTVVECDMSRIERQRRALGLTALPLIAVEAIAALRDFPGLNATLDGDVLTGYDRVHLGIAVSLGEDGLIVPVIHDAQDLSAEGLGRRIKDLAGRARGKQLLPDEVRGGTFTITNPGAAGALIATPVINVPQVAILDLEAIVKRPVVVTDEDGNDSIAIRPMANLCLSWDHRALDGMYAAQFLTALRKRLEGVGG
ncbi:dihydrolipoamide acetyltransferase family protein [Patulibacter defluvii]|uniref:dihydrolipoamide acetyltransferase family protein n=1 Tax=Patulibacter defluvii TaxID=3095358 RepID=UPI002A74C4BA|nr:dihydrolipoamide acetyltransferase family protein [Patulibacter sp. DM4]